MSSRATSGSAASAAATTSSPRGDLGHDLDVGLELEQAGQRAPHHRLVLGDQDPDHRHGARERHGLRDTGTDTASRKPPPGRAAGLDVARAGLGALAQPGQPVAAA